MQLYSIVLVTKAATIQRVSSGKDTTSFLRSIWMETETQGASDGEHPAGWVDEIVVGHERKL